MVDILESAYLLEYTDELITPSLVFYKDIIRKNLDEMLRIAGGGERLWPHIKSHKMSALIKLQIEKGITKFKCATIAEAEMAAACGAEQLILAYPLIGPNIRRFIALCKAFPDCLFWAIGDDFDMLTQLNAAAEAENLTVHLLLDVNMGTNRTGVPPENLESLYRQCLTLSYIHLDGLHCYDGNLGISELNKRSSAINAIDSKILQAVKNLRSEHIPCTNLIMGGTPTFPFHALNPEFYMSPGTCVISDYGYAEKYPDEHFIPAGLVLTRVVSHAAEGYFTLDLGYKGIAADPVGVRGKLLGIEHACSVSQNEEHWVWKMDEGFEDARPAIGKLMYVIPTHICPTSLLYPYALVSQGGKLTERWAVDARDRQLTI